MTHFFNHCFVTVNETQITTKKWMDYTPYELSEVVGIIHSNLTVV